MNEIRSVRRCDAKKGSIIFSVLGVFSLIGAITLAVLGHEGWGTALTASALLLVFGNLDRFKSFNIGGVVNGETRAEHLVEQAEKTLGDTRSLVIALTKYLKWQHQGSGRYGGPGKKAEQIEQDLLRDLLEDAGMTEADLEEIASVEYPFTKFDYGSGYVTAAVSQEGWSNEQHTAWNEYFDAPRSAELETEPSPSDLRVFLDINGFMNPEVDERLMDCAHWDENRTHRRPDEWKIWKGG